MMGTIFLFMIFGSIVYTAYIQNDKSIPLPKAQPETKILLFKAEKIDLESFTVHPSDGVEYTIQFKDNIYVLQDRPDYQLNKSIIDEMVDSLIYLEAEDLKFAVEEDHLSDYGLNDEAIRVTARFKNNQNYTFKIGQTIPSDIPKDFGVFNDSLTLYAFSITLKDIFDQEVNWLHVVPDINFTPDLLDRVIFDGNNEKLILQRKAKDLWTMEEPFLYPVDELKIKKMSDSISKMRFASFVETASEESIHRYGLDEPRFRITFMLAPSVITSISSTDGRAFSQVVDAQEITIQIGNSIAGIGFYCRYLDTIYQASDLSMGFMLETNAAYYVSQFPMNIPLNLVNTLAIKGIDRKDHNYAISLVEHILPNNQVAQDSQGNILYDYFILSEKGTEISAENFIKLYHDIISLNANGTLEGFSPPAESSPLMQIQISYLNEQRIIKFFSLDALHAAVEVEGTSIYYTDLANLKKIEAQLSLLKD